MAIIKNWGYGETIDRYNKPRINGRYVGRMNKTEFIRTICRGYPRGVKWITDRMGNTGNDFELELIKQYPDKVVLYDSNSHEVLEILNKI
jgi:hypothetical protein